MVETAVAVKLVGPFGAAAAQKAQSNVTKPAILLRLKCKSVISASVPPHLHGGTPETPDATRLR
jgi:hypothetical protein